MASLVATKRVQESLVKPLIINGVRQMTILSKESAEEYKKLVSSFHRAMGQNRSVEDMFAHHIHYISHQFSAVLISRTTQRA